MADMECTCTWRPEAIHGNDHDGATLTATRVDNPDCPEHGSETRDDGVQWVPWQCQRCGKTATARLGAVVRCTCGSRSLASGGQ